jgi:hypothetical protein
MQRNSAAARQRTSGLRRASTRQRDCAAASISAFETRAQHRQKLSDEPAAAIANDEDSRLERPFAAGEEGRRTAAFRRDAAAPVARSSAEADAARAAPKCIEYPSAAHVRQWDRWNAVRDAAGRGGEERSERRLHQRADEAAPVRAWGAGRNRGGKHGHPDGGRAARAVSGAHPAALHFIVGMTNSAPSLVPEGQRAVTVLVLV